jgi:hypothetical protein
VGYVRDREPRPPGSIHPPNPPPKNTPDATDYHSQTSETGRPIPIVYGTERVTAQLLERYLGSFVATTQQNWKRSTAYALGDFVRNQGNIYLCSQAGTSLGSGDGPSGTGNNIVDNTAKWDYAPMGYRHFVALGFCEGLIYDTGKAWVDKQVYSSVGAGLYNTGIPHDATWSRMYLGRDVGDRPGVSDAPSWFPDTASGASFRNVYRSLATLWLKLTTASDAALPESISLEIKGIFCDSTHVDVSPADIATDLLTHTRRGIGWPSGRVDSVSTGVGTASWRTYCTAYGLNLSWSIEQQSTVLSLLEVLLQATNTDAVWTNRPDGLGGMIKFVPLGDEAITANGVTYTPNSTPAYSLTNDDFLGELEVSRISPADTYNAWPVEFTSRADDYRRISVTDPEMADVDLRGLKTQSAVSLPFVISTAAATMLSRIYANRSLQIRNQYRFRLPWRFLLLEPTDLLTISDTVSGISNVAVRVVSVQEDPDANSFELVCEDWPAKVATAAQYTPQLGDGFKPAQDSPLNTLIVLPQQVGSQTIVQDRFATGLLNKHNSWPNSTSETSPPEGVVVLNDGTNPEYDYRFSAGPGGGVNQAKVGRWVRKLGKTSSGAGDGLTLLFRMPTTSGDRFLFSTWAQWRSTGGTPTGAIFVTTRNEDLAAVSSYSGLSISTGTTGWAQLASTYAADSVWMDFECRLSFGAVGTAEIWFDEISVTRQITAADIDGGAVTESALYEAANARGIRGSAQSIPANTWTTIVWADTTPGYDFFNKLNSSTGVYTVPTFAKYSISSVVTLAGGVATINAYALAVYVNGAEAARLYSSGFVADGFGAAGTWGGDISFGGSGTLLLNVNDTVEIKVFQNSGGPVNTQNGNALNWFTIEQIAAVKPGH